MALAHWETEALMQPGELLTLGDVFPARPAWMASAACRGVNAATFFPSRGEPTDAARELCAGCPARGPCLAYALDDEALEGVWAGTSKQQRRAMRREASSPA